MKVKSKLLILAAFVFASMNAFADEKGSRPNEAKDDAEPCQSLLSQSLLSSSGGSKTLESYNDLPDFHLDLSDIQKSVAELIEEVGHLSGDYKNLKTLESARPTNLAELKALQSKVEGLKEKIQQDAVRAINELHPELPPERKTLEGYRILNKRITTLSDRYAARLKEAKSLPNKTQPDETQPGEEQPSDPNDNSVNQESPGQEGSSQESSQPSSQKDSSTQPQTQNTDDQNTQHSKCQANDCKSENSDQAGKQTGKTDASQNATNKTSNELYQSLKNRMPELLKNKHLGLSQTDTGPLKHTKTPPQAKQPSDNEGPMQKAKQKTRQKEGTEQKGHSSQNQDGEPSPGQPNQAQQSSQAQSSDGESSSGQPNQAQQSSQAQSSDGESSSGQPDQVQQSSQVQSSDGESSSGQPNQAQQSSQAQKSSAKNTKAPSSEQKGGRQAGDGHLGQDLSEALRKTLAKRAATSSKDSPLSYGNNNDADLKEKNYSKLNLEPLNNKHTTTPKKSWKELQRNQKSFKKTTPRPKRTNLRNLNQEQQAQMVKLFIEQAWAHTLDNYANSARYKKSLTHFMSLANALFVQFPAMHLLQQYAQKAAEYIEELSVLSVEYDNLEDLGLSVIRTGTYQEAGILRKLTYIEIVLTQLESVRNLELAEQRTLDLVRKILAHLSLDADPTDKELGEAFYNLMQGPLSRAALERDFVPRNPRESLDWSQLAESIRAGKLNDLVLFSRMAPFADILINEIFKPNYQPQPIGDNEPINEYDSVIDGAYDFEELPDVIKEGFPAKIEILRMLAGDSLKNAYKAPVDVSTPKKPLSHKVTIVLFDISGSMQGPSEVARNAILASFVDKSQLEVIREEGTHTLYMIPFDDSPHQAERLGDLGQAGAYFDRVRSQPIGSGGGTSISDAMIKAFELIAEHQESGGELERGNVLLITDGCDSICFSSIQEARNKIDPEIDIALNAVTITEWNEDISRMVERYTISAEGKIGKASHQHIPSEDLERYLNVQLYVNALQKYANTFNEAKTRSLPNKFMVSFKDALIRVKTEQERSAQRSSSTTRGLIKKLTLPVFSAPKKYLHPEVILFNRFAMSAITDSWSENKKAAAFSSFVDILVDVYAADSDLILSSITPDDRARIIKYITD